MGEGARSVIAEALAALHVETRPGIAVAAIDPGGATLTTGERIDAATVIWCAGMQANPLTACFPAGRDRFRRLAVKPSLKIDGQTAEFAAGDVAWFAIDGTHSCVMSCQHGRPMGRFAGHNVVCDLLGEPLLPLTIDWYTTMLVALSVPARRLLVKPTFIRTLNRAAGCVFVGFGLKLAASPN